jgi:hypothetical protein
VRLASLLAALGHEVVIRRNRPLTGLAGFPRALRGLGARRRRDRRRQRGAMLSIARRLAPLDVPLIGVNQGRLGF